MGAHTKIRHVRGEDGMGMGWELGAELIRAGSALVVSNASRTLALGSSLYFIRRHVRGGRGEGVGGAEGELRSEQGSELIWC